MARNSEHTINRKLTAQLPKSIDQVNCLSQALALSEISIIDKYLPEDCKEVIEFNNSMNEAKELLHRFEIIFRPEISFHNPPDTKDAIVCASYFLKFNVTSERDIRRIFGDTITNKIVNNEGILTYKDNLNPKSSDKKLLFNFALIYCVNAIQSNDKEKSIPFDIFNENVFSIQLDEDYSAFLFNALESIKGSSIDHSPFSSSFNSLYRAYERYVIPSNELISLLVKTRKRYSRESGKYSDNTVFELNSMKTAIISAQWQLMNYIKNNIVSWLEDDEQRCIKQEIDEAHQETISLLNDTIDEFAKRKSKGTLSSEYFRYALTHMNSTDDICMYISTIKSLFTLQDDFMFEEFKKIIFHLLGRNKLSISPVNTDSIFDHLDRNPISDASILDLADFLYGISDITDEEYLLLDSILYSLSNSHNKFVIVYNLLQAYALDSLS